MRALLLRATLFAAVTPFLVCQSVTNADHSVDRSATVNWLHRTVELTVTAPLNPLARNAPAHPYQQQEAIRRSLPAITQEILSEITFDSGRTIGEIVRAQPYLIGELQGLSTAFTSEQMRVTGDLSMVEVRYTLPLLPNVLNALSAYGAPQPLPRSLGWEATDLFTGVVIYAQDPLPVRGENRTDYLRPALLPELFDTALNPIVTPRHIDGAVLEQRGVVSYTTSVDPAEWEAVVGPNPLRVVAREIFGVYGTDIILPLRDARRLLSTSENRRMLAAGRILVVLNPRFATQDL